MNITTRQFNALYDLMNTLTGGPALGTTSTTPRVLAEYASRAQRQARIALRILQELPHHSDKGPLDMEDALQIAEEYLR